MGDDFAELEVHDGDKVRAIPTVKDGSVTAARMDGDVHWEIAHLDLFAGGAQGPLVGEENGAVGFFARELREGIEVRAERSVGGNFVRMVTSAPDHRKRADDERKDGNAHFCGAVCASHCRAGKETKAFGK